MKKFILGLIIGFVAGSAIIAIAAGMTKFEMKNPDASSTVGYGTSDAGDSIVRIKTDANGVLQIKGV
jgi:hypothetical protein